MHRATGAGQWRAGDHVARVEVLDLRGAVVARFAGGQIADVASLGRTAGASVVRITAVDGSVKVMRLDAR